MRTYDMNIQIIRFIRFFYDAVLYLLYAIC